MPSITGPLMISSADVFETSATDEHGLGTIAYDTVGRVLRWSKAGSSNISRGKLQLGPAIDTNYHEMAVSNSTNTGQTIGNTKLDITPGASAATANEYAQGLLVVNDDTGEGIAYEVDSHPAASSSTEFTLTLKDPIKVAFGNGTTVTLEHNYWNGVVEGTAQNPGRAAGIAANNITASEFGWLITRGVAPGLSDENGTVNRALTVGSSTAGALEERDDLTESTDGSRFSLEQEVAYQIVAMVDGEYRPVFVNID